MEVEIMSKWIPFPRSYTKKEEKLLISKVIDVEDDLEDLNVDTRPAFKFPQRGSIERRTMVRPSPSS